MPRGNKFTAEQIIENDPDITHDDVAACLCGASDALKSERVISLTLPG